MFDENRLKSINIDKKLSLLSLLGGLLVVYGPARLLQGGPCGPSIEAESLTQITDPKSEYLTKTENSGFQKGEQICVGTPNGLLRLFPRPE